VTLREIDGVYGGELAGHYYFRDFYYCDSGELAALLVLNVVKKFKEKKVPFSQLIDTVNPYAFSGEINFRIEKKGEAMEALRKEYAGRHKPTAVYDFDGYRIEFEDWWFNVRPSNTEPYLRLVAEAKDTSMLEEKLEQIRSVLAAFE
jgi:phosphomannomutase